MEDRYFQGAWPVKPLGWHQQLLGTKTTTNGAIRHELDQQTSTPTSLQLRGWAFLSSTPGIQLYLLADYGTKQRLAIPVNQPRRDVKRAHHLAIKNVGFDANILATTTTNP